MIINVIKTLTILEKESLRLLLYALIKSKDPTKIKLT